MFAVVLALAAISWVSPAQASRPMRLGGGTITVDDLADQLVVRRPVAKTAAAFEDDLRAAGARLGVAITTRALTQQLVVITGSGLESPKMRTAFANALAQPVWRGLSRSTGRAYAIDELVVTAAPGALERVLGEVMAKVDGNLVRISTVPNTALITVGAAIGFDAVDASVAIGAMDGLISAEPNLLRELALRATVNDPLYSDQWHLDRAANSPIPGAGTIGVEGAWDVTKGDPSITVAVVDSGTDYGHPDLAPNLAPGGFDAIDGDDDPSPGCTPFDGGAPSDDCPGNAPIIESHGTSVSGLVAATGDNDIGVSGVCPRCTLLPVRLIGGFAVTALTTAETFVRVVDLGAAVINNSWGPGRAVFFPLAQAEHDSLVYARTVGRGGRGTVVLFAAGNETANVRGDPYARDPLVLAIAATDNLDNWTGYSNFGFGIDVAAPSQGDTQIFDFDADDFGMVTTDVRGDAGYSNGDEYDADYTPGFGGTSAASPVAAGLVALLLSGNPELTAEQIRLVLTSTADQITGDAAFWAQAFGDVTDAFSYDENGHSSVFGYGRINATAAMTLALNPAALGQAGLPCGPTCTACSVGGTCLQTCDDQTDCVRGTICNVELGACEMPNDRDIDFLALCSADVDCTYCVPGLDSNGESASVCARTCNTDADCDPSCVDDRGCGFDCRLLAVDEPRLCVVGSNVGDPDDLFDCNGLAVASIEGRNLCTEICDVGNNTCPYGTRCEDVPCACSQEFDGQCFAFLCGENLAGNDPLPVCIPEDGFTSTCTTDIDCQRGDYCGPDGACRVDDRPVDGSDGCGVCDVCSSDADCLGRGRCLGTRGGQQTGVCLWTCDDVDECPGDSECQLYEARFGTLNVCVAPGDHGVEPTPQDLCADYNCVTSCRDDVACPDGFRCSGGSCEVVVVNDVPAPPAAISVRGAGLASACGAGGAAHVVVMAMLMLRRRRR